MGAVRIARSLVDEIVEHARADAPEECCGMIAAEDGRAVRVHRIRNRDASPLRYTLDPLQQFAVEEEIEEAGHRVGAIYHSHTRSEPYPSQTDINLASPLYPDVLQVIVGVAGAQADVRAFRIAGGQVTEAALEIEEE